MTYDTVSLKKISFKLFKNNIGKYFYYIIIIYSNRYNIIIINIYDKQQTPSYVLMYYTFIYIYT